MNDDTICLSSEYSTTRFLTKTKIEILNKTYEKFNSILLLPETENRKGEGGLRTHGFYKQNLPGKPLITIITVVLNGEKDLEKTILSVLNQTYDNVEYIVIDGNSTDGTVNIIKKYEDKIDYWISEKDNGISDAFNKGVQLSFGLYINFQGDGDGFYSKEVLETVFKDINPKKDIFISGRIQRIDKDGNELFVSKRKKIFKKESLLFRMSVPHQGLFTNISYFKQYGLFDINNIYCMDYEHLLRAYQDFPDVVVRDVIVAKWKEDGLGTDKTLEILKEYNKIKRDNKVANSFILKIINIWLLIKYHLKKVILRNY